LGKHLLSPDEVIELEERDDYKNLEEKKEHEPGAPLDGEEEQGQ